MKRRWYYAKKADIMYCPKCFMSFINITCKFWFYFSIQYTFVLPWGILLETARQILMQYLLFITSYGEINREMKFINFEYKMHMFPVITQVCLFT